MKTVSGLEKIPEDTGLRECLDGVNYDLLQASFKTLFQTARSENLLAVNRVPGDRLAASFDGTGFMTLPKIRTGSSGEKVYL